MLTANDVVTIDADQVMREQSAVDGRIGSELVERGGMPVVRGAYAPVKAAAEWVAAVALLILVSPLILLLAVAVKLTSTGPAFYAQTRLGQFGRKYRMFKLRTMVHGAEAGTGPVWATKNDGRITPIGKFLRNTHLDELPQLWNVVRGEMGLIGPRPERPEIAARIERQIPDFRHRLAVRPGVTGLAQMLLPADDPNDVNLEGLRKKLAHDLYYVRKLNFLLDLRIAASTPCYFLAAMIDAMRHSLVGSYGAAVNRAGEAADQELEGCGRAA